MRHRRFDRGTLAKAERLDNGWVRAPAAFTKAGIFLYRNPDGTTRKELRAPDDVFKADSLQTLSMVPLTLEHPPVLLNADNTDQFAVGSIGDSVRRDGDLVRGSIMVTDARAAKDLLDGVRVETSCGYTCEMEETPGVWNGERYDAKQVGIAYNHVALVTVGRAGPEVRVKLDAADAIMVSDETSQSGEPAKEPTVLKIKIDGVEYEVSEQVHQAVSKLLSRRDDSVTEAEKKATKAQAAVDVEKARADAAEAQVKKLDAEVKALRDPKAIDARVSERSTLVGTARKVLGEEAKFDGKSDSDVKRAVLAKLLPDVKLDGKSAEYVDAAFDAAVARFDVDNPALAGVRETIDGGADDEGSAPNPKGGLYEAAREKHKKDSADAWKRKPSVGVFRE